MKSTRNLLDKQKQAILHELYVYVNFSWEYQAPLDFAVIKSNYLDFLANGYFAYNYQLNFVLAVCCGSRLTSNSQLRLSVVETLVQLGANVDCNISLKSESDKYEYCRSLTTLEVFLTPLHLAAQNSYNDVLQCLLRAGAKIDTSKEICFTDLQGFSHYSCESNSLPINLAIAANNKEGIEMIQNHAIELEKLEAGRLHKQEQARQILELRVLIFNILFGLESPPIFKHPDIVSKLLEIDLEADDNHPFFQMLDHFSKNWNYLNAQFILVRAQLALDAYLHHYPVTIPLEANTPQWMRSTASLGLFTGIQSTLARTDETKYKAGQIESEIEKFIREKNQGTAFSLLRKFHLLKPDQLAKKEPVQLPLEKNPQQENFSQSQSSNCILQ